MRLQRVACLALLVSLCFAISGCVESSNPLSDVASAKADQRLLGTWKSTNENQGNLVIGKPDAALGFPRGVMLCTLERPQGDPLRWLFFSTVIDDASYENILVPKKEDGKKYQSGKWAASDEIGAYLIGKYQVTEDRLTLSKIDPAALKQAIESGKITGTVKKPQSKLTDTTANLHRLFAAEGNTLFVPSHTYTKVK